MANLHTKINNIMAQQNKSISDIERETKLNRNTICSIIYGVSKNPSATNLLPIAKALNVSLESLIDDEDIPLEFLSHKQMKVFSETTNATINVIIKKKLNFSLDKLISIIKEVYQFALKTDPPKVNPEFIDYQLDKIDSKDMRTDSLSNKQMQAFSEATNSTIDIIIEKNVNYTMYRLITLIKQVYRFSIKSNAPTVNPVFIEWLIEDKYKN